MKKLFFILLFFAAASSIHAQDVDTVNVVVPEEKGPKDPRPRRATIMSAIIPGLGQAYNGDYWKIPIIYLAEGALIYSAIYSHTNYKRFWLAYTLRADGLDVTVDEFDEANSILYSNEQQLRLERDNFRRNRDLAVLVAVLIYGINILDAHVFAHLNNFEITDDLSLNVKPFYYNANSTNFATGLSLKLNIK